MKTESFDSSGKRRYVSGKDIILEVVSHLTSQEAASIKNSDKKGPTRAREIMTLLMSENMKLSNEEMGRFLNQTATGARNQRIRGARRLRSDEEFAHTFAVAEIRSNTADE